MSIDLSNFINRGEAEFHIKGKVSRDKIKLEGDETKTLLGIEYKGTVYRINNSYSLSLDIFYSYETKCARCLKTTVEESKTRLDVNLEDISKKDEENDNTLFLKNGILEIEELAITEVHSSIPIKILCDVNCKGLCMKCGVDLNNESCDCVLEYLDPRLEKLKNIFLND